MTLEEAAEEYRKAQLEWQAAEDDLSRLKAQPLAGRDIEAASQASTKAFLCKELLWIAERNLLTLVMGDAPWRDPKWLDGHW